MVIVASTFAIPSALGSPSVRALRRTEAEVESFLSSTFLPDFQKGSYFDVALQLVNGTSSDI